MLARLRRLRAESMPSSAQVVREACDRLGLVRGGASVQEMRDSFDSQLRALFETTLEVLEDHEERVDGGIVLPELVRSSSPDVEAEFRRFQESGGTPDAGQRAVAALLRKWRLTLRGLFLSVSQSRKQRGGKDFEYQIRELLELAAIPHEAQSKRERADFLLPSADILHSERPRAVLLSVKRTLRERWQQVVRELQDIGCPNTYLATAEDKVAPTVVANIARHNIYVVVWDSVKAEKFADDPMVVGYTKLVHDITSHFMPQWPPPRPRS